MAEIFSRVAILGLGLMGGSLALALRNAGVAEQIAGYDRTPEVAVRASERGMVDEACVAVAEAVREADLVVLAAPVLAERALLEQAAPHLTPGAVVTDLGSTKRVVVGWAEELLLVPAHFVGGHPMAGRELSGLDASDATLYHGAVWCLTPTPQTDPEVVRRLSSLITAVGASPLLLDPERHDHLIAGVSHLSILVAAGLVRTLASDGGWAELALLAAGGFRDTTRIASGDPRMARDICLTNRDEIVRWVDAYLATLHQLRDMVAAEEADGGATIEAHFREAREVREDWLRTRG
ncbi:MAG: prephenate dehydrogenase [Ktedonobacterales bacterium]